MSHGDADTRARLEATLALARERQTRQYWAWREACRNVKVLERRLRTLVQGMQAHPHDAAGHSTTTTPPLPALSQLRDVRSTSSLPPSAATPVGGREADVGGGPGHHDCAKER